MGFPNRRHRILIWLYGEAAVDQAGRAVLGYPGAWITDRGEALKIQPYLIENRHHKPNAPEKERKMTWLKQ
jgi:hypothetical protein